MTASESNSRRYRTISAALSLVVAVLLAHLYLPPFASDLSVQTIQSLHGPGFGFVAIAILILVRDTERPLAAYVKAALLTMALAGLAEAAQIPGPRDAQFGDLVIDAVGVTGFLSINALFDPQLRHLISRRNAILVALLGGSAMVLTLAPVLQLSNALIQRQRSLPQILSFEHAWERNYSTTSEGKVEVIPAPEGWPVSDGKVARLRSAGQWGIMLRIFPAPDWSAYSAMSFVAASDSERRQITIVIRDSGPGRIAVDERYSTEIIVGPKPTRFTVPFAKLLAPSSKRPLDLAHIRSLVVSDSRAETGIQLWLDDFRIEK